jgi:hypothetical protein
VFRTHLEKNAFELYVRYKAAISTKSELFTGRIRIQTVSGDSQENLYRPAATLRKSRHLATNTYPEQYNQLIPHGIILLDLFVLRGPFAV